MKEFLYKIVEWMAKFHNYFMRLNDAFEYDFSDKELHFLVIGAMGMGFIFVVYPVFKWLANRKHIMTIAWIYVFTLIIVITFGIEIGQKVTNTGVMEFADIMFGVVGFIVMFLIFAVLRGIWHMFCRFWERHLEEHAEEAHADKGRADKEYADKGYAYKERAGKKHMYEEDEIAYDEDDDMEYL